VLTKTGIILDLSDGGALLSTEQPFPIGTSFFLSFELPNGDKVDYCKSLVRHVKADTESKTYHIGVEFIDLDNSLERQTRAESQAAVHIVT
jgi:Tfp pilus assembly protein PilZ